MVKRTAWIDMAKGIGIILVILGHISFRPQSINVWLCSFHMPLFFFLSGITYNPDKYNKFGLFLKTKIKQLVIPYFIFATVALLWKIAQQGINFLSGDGFNWVYIIKQFFGIFLQIRTTDYGIGVWFVPCIFCAFILLFVICKLSRGNNVIAFLISAISLVAGYLYATFVDIKLPWGLDASFVAVFFMTLGMIVKKQNIIEKLKSNIYIAISLVLSILFAYLNYTVLGRTVGMWSNNYGNLIYFILGALSGIIFIVCLTQKKSNEYLQDIGRNSIFYYGIHIIILEATGYFTKFIPLLWNDIVAFVASVCLLVFTVFVLKRLYPLYKGIYDKILNFLSF